MFRHSVYFFRFGLLHFYVMYHNNNNTEDTILQRFYTISHISKKMDVVTYFDPNESVDGLNFDTLHLSDRRKYYIVESMYEAVSENNEVLKERFGSLYPMFHWWRDILNVGSIDGVRSQLTFPALYIYYLLMNGKDLPYSHELNARNTFTLMEWLYSISTQMHRIVHNFITRPVNRRTVAGMDCATWWRTQTTYRSVEQYVHYFVRMWEMLNPKIGEDGMPRLPPPFTDEYGMVMRVEDGDMLVDIQAPNNLGIGFPFPSSGHRQAFIHLSNDFPFSIYEVREAVRGGGGANAQQDQPLPVATAAAPPAAAAAAASTATDLIDRLPEMAEAAAASAIGRVTRKLEEGLSHIVRKKAKSATGQVKKMMESGKSIVSKFASAIGGGTTTTTRSYDDDDDDGDEQQPPTTTVRPPLTATTATVPQLTRSRRREDDDVQQGDDYEDEYGRRAGDYRRRARGEASGKFGQVFRRLSKAPRAGVVYLDKVLRRGPGKK